MSRVQGVPGTEGTGRASAFLTRLLYLLLPAACLCFAILRGLPGAVHAPDAGDYRWLALGQRDLVPAPFSARILGPAAAGWLGRATGAGVDTGFLILGVVCLVALVALLAGILRSWRAPVAMFAAIFLMPFWVDLFHDYYLPDLLHATLLAVLLACLLWGQTGLALLLIFPAYLVRESTILVAVCLAFAAWRRIGLRTALIGVAATVCGAVVSAHYGHEGPGSIHGVSGGIYIAGKLVWNFFKNVLGLPLWSNTLPECNPIWVKSLSHPSGAIGAIGVCQPSLWGPVRLLLAWFGYFGIAPALTLVLLQREGRELMRRVNALRPGLSVVLRFSVLYGCISILVTPLLGASIDRLVAYGWPFCFVALPWFVSQFVQVRAVPLILALHLLTCWLAWYALPQQIDIFAGVAVLGLNGLAYWIIRLYSLSTTVDKLWIQPVSDPLL